jgi:hypothetical protein
VFFENVMRALVILAFAIEILTQQARADPVSDVDARQKTRDLRGAEQFEIRFESAPHTENNYVATYSNHFNTRPQNCFSCAGQHPLRDDLKCN